MKMWNGFQSLNKIKKKNRVVFLRLSRISVPLVRSGFSSRPECAYSWNCTVLMWELYVQLNVQCNAFWYLLYTDTQNLTKHILGYWMSTNILSVPMKQLCCFLFSFLCLSSRVSKHAALLSTQNYLKHFLT